MPTISISIYYPEISDIVDSIFDGSYYGGVDGGGYKYWDIVKAINDDTLKDIDINRVMSSLSDMRCMMEDHICDLDSNDLNINNLRLIEYELEHLETRLDVLA